jgi:pyoverdine/dityrosine biosynthesis protein Dit1
MPVSVDTLTVSPHTRQSSVKVALTSLTSEPSMFELSNAPTPAEMLLASSPSTQQDLLADKITDHIAGFLYLKSPNDRFEAVGRSALRQTVHRYIERGEQMELVFPGFPFKSPSDKKVLGRLPDLGEETLLRRLEDLARTIDDHHPAGAVVRIVSDGIVYGEILGQNDRAVYRYNETLRKMTVDFGLTHITFVRVVDLLDAKSGLSQQIMSEDEYAESIPLVRERFLAHEVPGYDLERDMKESPGTLRTYRGYLKFLERDLAGTSVMNGKDGKPLSKNGQDRARRVIAKQMLRNGAKFSDLAALKFPDCIRLSVHPHSNAGPKFAFDMFPGLDMAASPWHNVVMEKSDGRLTMGQYASFDPSTYDVVYRNGYPYHLREKSEDRELGNGITLTPAFPFGLTITAERTEGDASRCFRFEDLEMSKLRSLAFKYSLLVLRGFEMPGGNGKRELNLEGLSASGSDTPTFQPLQHCDGAAGSLQFIHCIKSLPKSAIALTNTASILQRGITADQIESLNKRYWITSSPAEETHRFELIVRNHHTDRQALRYPVYCESATKPVISGLSVEESDGLHEKIMDLLHDRRFCYTHQLEDGDVIIYDSTEVVRSQSYGSYQGEELQYATIY